MHQDKICYNCQAFDGKYPPIWVQVLAVLGSKIVLCGFLVLPPVLPKIQHSSKLNEIIGNNVISHSIQHWPLFVVASVLSLFGVAALVGCYCYQRRQYVFVREYLLWYVLRSSTVSTRLMSPDQSGLGNCSDRLC